MAKIASPDRLLDPAADKRRSSAHRARINAAFYGLCVLATASSVLFLVVLLGSVLRDGAGWLTPTLLTQGPNRDPNEAGIFPLIMGTTWVCLACALFTLPIGVATAIYLEEFRPRHKVLRWLHGFVQLNIQNLSGVPSIVYGILGLTAFVYLFGLFGSVRAPAFEFGIAFYDQFEAADGDLANDVPASIVFVPVKNRQHPDTELVEGLSAFNSSGEQIKLRVLPADAPNPTDPELAATSVRQGELPGRKEVPRWYYLRLPLGRSVLSGALTLMLVILPVVIIASQEALRAVPSSLRDGALGMGATPLQTVWNVTLPAAIPGIMTGSILAMSRAIGEAAPIMIVAGAIVNIPVAPRSVMDGYSVLPIQIYNWTEDADPRFPHLAAASILVLLTVLLVFNGVAVFIRHRLQKPLS
jgi:phosphate transport system permease protein